MRSSTSIVNLKRKSNLIYTYIIVRKFYKSYWYILLLYMQLHSFTFIEVHVLESKTYKKTLLASKEKAQTMVV